MQSPLAKLPDLGNCHRVALLLSTSVSQHCSTTLPRNRSGAAPDTMGLEWVRKRAPFQRSIPRGTQHCGLHSSFLDC